jgi:hypothetical protein
MLALKFPGMKNAQNNNNAGAGASNGENKNANPPGGSLPTLVKSAGPPPKIQ